MGVDGFGEVPHRADPIRTFAERLRELQVGSGGPSVRDLVRLTEKVGAPYTRGTIQDKLAGRSVASWEFVETFVLACTLHAGSTAPPDLPTWRRRHAEMARAVAASRVGRRPVVQTGVSPYRGLEAFTAEHAQWFHGRAGAVDQLVAGLDAHRAGIVVLGPSGAGKSSVVQAGLLPALAGGALPGSDRWTVVPARPGAELPAELERAGLSGAGDERAGAVAAGGAHVLLVIDQFEELLTPAAGDGQAAAQQEVITRLTAAVGDPGLSVVLVMRDDFYPRLASQAPALLRALTPGLLNVPAMLGTQALREIITRPAGDVGLGFQDGLPERIIADVLAVDPAAGAIRQAPVTVLPLLELTLEQLWQRRRGNLLTHEAYQRTGGIAGALTTWCDSAIQQLRGDRRTTAQRILTALVRPADDERHIPAVRQRVPLEVLRRLAGSPAPGSDQPSPLVDEVVGALTDHRIVTTRTARTYDQRTGTPGVPVAELIHEALIRDWATLRDWVGQDHRFQDWLRRAAERHSRWVSTRDPGDLLHGGELAEGLDWSARRRLPDQVADLLAASRRYQRTGVRRARIVAAVLAASLVVALAATGLALRQRQSAVTAQRVALSRQLAAESTALISADADLAGLLAVQAYRTSPTAEATAAVYAAAASPLLHRLETDTQWSLAFSGDRRTLAIGGFDGTVRLWDVPAGELRTTLRGHSGPVWETAFSSDNHTLATAGDDRTVRLWDITGAQPPATLQGHTAAVTAILFSPDGRTLVSADQHSKIRLWDVAGRRLRATLPGHAATFTPLAISPDGHTLAAAGAPGTTVRLWDPRSGRSLAVLRGHTGTVNAVAFSPDGKTLASAGEDRTVRFWTVPGGRPRSGTLRAHTDGVRAVAFSPDGRILATGSNDHTARLWDFAERRARTTLAGHSDDVNEFAFSPDGTAVLTAGNDGAPRLWNVADGRLRVIFSGGGTNAFAFSPDGRSIATAGNSGARLWDATVGLPRRELADGTDNMWIAVVAPTGTSVATAGGDATIRLWEIATGHRTATLDTRNDEVKSLAFSRDGRLLVSASSSGATPDGTVHLWDPARRTPRAVLGHAGTTVAVSPDGRTLAGSHDNGVILVRDTADPSRQTTLEGHTGQVFTLAFSPDGRTLASSSRDRTVRLWDVGTGRERLALRGHSEDVGALAFSPDGRTVASGSWDGARLWDAATGHLRTSLTGHAQRVTAVAFSPDGATLATAGADSSVRLWDLATGNTREAIGGYTDAVTSVAFSPDGKLLVTAGWHGTVKVWNVALPTTSTAISKICRTVDRDFSPQERSAYLAREPAEPVCP